MRYNSIRCEVVEVRTDTGLCPGLAGTERGEVFMLGPRTPETRGICCQALASIGPMKLAMALTEKMSWETREYFDVRCPHGVVTFRISRAEGIETIPPNRREEHMQPDRARKTP